MHKFLNTRTSSLVITVNIFGIGFWMISHDQPFCCCNFITSYFLNSYSIHHRNSSLIDMNGSFHSLLFRTPRIQSIYRYIKDPPIRFATIDHKTVIFRTVSLRPRKNSSSPSELLHTTGYLTGGYLYGGCGTPCSSGKNIHKHEWPCP